MCATCQLSACLPLVCRAADATSCQSLIWRNLLNALPLPLPQSLSLSLPLQLLPTDDKRTTATSETMFVDCPSVSGRTITVHACLAGLWACLAVKRQQQMPLNSSRTSSRDRGSDSDVDAIYNRGKNHFSCRFFCVRFSLILPVLFCIFIFASLFVAFWWHFWNKFYSFNWIWFDVLFSAELSSNSSSWV